MFNLREKDIISIFLIAIAKQEGFFNEANPAFKNKNPGNLIDPAKGVLRKCETLEEGWQIAEDQIYKNVFVRNLTFYEFFAGQRNKDGSLVFKGYPGYAPAPPPTGIVHKLLIGNKPKIYAEAIVQAFRNFLPASKASKVHIDMKIRDLCL